MMLAEVKSIGNNIGLYLKNNKISYRTASLRSGYSISTISELINGQDKKLSYYINLAKSVGMPIKSLLETELTQNELELIHYAKTLTNVQRRLIIELLKTTV